MVKKENTSFEKLQKISWATFSLRYPRRVFAREEMKGKNKKDCIHKGEVENKLPPRKKKKARENYKKKKRKH